MTAPAGTDKQSEATIEQTSNRFGFTGESVAPKLA
jgi:hypothetical protein